MNCDWPRMQKARGPGYIRRKTPAVTQQTTRNSLFQYTVNSLIFTQYTIFITDFFTPSRWSHFANPFPVHTLLTTASLLATDKPDVHQLSFGVRYLLDQGADAKATDDAGWTPLIIAASVGGPDVLKLDRNRNSALQRAVIKGHVSMAMLLLDSGARLSQTDLEGNTALPIACEEGYMEVAQLLLERDANLDAVSKAEKPPLDLAPAAVRTQLERVIKG
ncbi:hypothetical protein IWQ60_002620 [Tieghemiomyces parasiticus]|uniref:Ankyrin n=1 Tax=Tieghemiomyces parasiticus TaxID=78921 RepID=A0A9W8AAZ7_9FUNG|nr:hypothetical protein IWQ60_002620 [Tieghemiomyces parasiticus]